MPKYFNWKKYKKSGTYCRKLKVLRDNVRNASVSIINLETKTVDASLTSLEETLPSCSGISTVRYDIASDNFDSSSSSEDDKIKL